jgi:hypothetical protein
MCAKGSSACFVQPVTRSHHLKFSHLFGIPVNIKQNHQQPVGMVCHPFFKRFDGFVVRLVFQLGKISHTHKHHLIMEEALAILD